MSQQSLIITGRSPHIYILSTSEQNLTRAGRCFAVLITNCFCYVYVYDFSWHFNMTSVGENFVVCYCDVMREHFVAFIFTSMRERLWRFTMTSVHERFVMC